MKNNKIISQALLIFFILLIFISISFGVPLSSRTPLSRDGESSDYLDRIEVIDPSKVYQTPIEYPTEQQPNFENTMDSILNLLNSFEGFVGMELRNLSSNQVLLSFNEDKLFTPASLSKIITALISLESLGTNYRFETQVFRSSPITSNYNGNIYIKGFGNPVLSSDEYKYILKKATVDQGITKLYGNIVFDYSFLTEEGFGRGWMWDDPQPQIASINIWMSSHESLKYKTNGEIKDYLNFLTTVYLQELGVSFLGAIEYDLVPFSASSIYTHYSVPLKEIIKTMLETSDNQIAEQLFRNLGAIYGKGTISDSEKYFKQKIDEILGYKPSQYVLKDGCGLSKYNLLSPKMINDAVLYLYKNYSSSLLDWLAAPNEESTINNRFNFEIYAKTGTLYYDSAISAIIRTKKGNLYLLTLIENNFSSSRQSVKEFENTIINMIYSAL